jgi:hypothetical protein
VGYLVNIVLPLFDLMVSSGIIDSRILIHTLGRVANNSGKCIVSCLVYHCSSYPRFVVALALLCQMHVGGATVNFAFSGFMPSKDDTNIERAVRQEHRR